MLEILYEDNHLLAINKPAMLPTMGVAEDRPSLLAAAKHYIRKKYNKPGNVYLGIVSRLDAPVTGAVLLARTSKAAGRLSQQFRERDVEKVYWAIVEGNMEPAEGTLVDFLRKDERHRRMHVAQWNAPGAQRAELNYRSVMRDQPTGRQGNKEKTIERVSPFPPFSLSPCLTSASFLEVRPLTGRKHQIRLQLAHAGFPILGDRKYGSLQPFSVGIALHSRRLVIVHPVSKMQLEIEAPLPASWKTLLVSQQS
jgi:23S rRNA pseudouridine1911/1915/1917 synthase